MFGQGWQSEGKEVGLFLFAFALGPLLWIVLVVWVVVRQVTAPRLSLRYFAAAVGTQIVVILLPSVIYDFSVNEAGLSGFSGCPNGQEYCDEFFKLEALRDRWLGHLLAAFWVGIAVLLLALFTRIGKQDIRGKRSVR